MVGVAGFEPTASWSRTKRATKLRYTPKYSCVLSILALVLLEQTCKERSDGIASKRLASRASVTISDYPCLQYILQVCVSILVLVLLTGLEPVRSRPRGILSPLCLPIPPQQRTQCYKNALALISKSFFGGTTQI